MAPTTPPAFLSVAYQYDTGCDYAYETIPGVSAAVAQYAGLLEHEFFEAVTDPLDILGTAYATWEAGGVSETADVCQDIGSPEPMLSVSTQTSNFPYSTVTVHGVQGAQAPSSDGPREPSMCARQAATMKSWTKAPRLRSVA